MIHLELGDCLKILPTIGQVDAVITDPVWPNCPPGLLEGSDNPASLLRAALDLVETKRVVIVLRYDSDPRFLLAVPARWPFFRVQILRYAIPGYNGRKLGGIEFAYCFGEPVPSRPGRRVIPGEGPIVTKATPANGHPSPRAVGHFRWLVNWWTDPGETVLDPFMGSGTTGRACAEMGRDFIGIEIDPTYYAIAERRIQASPALLFEEVNG
jgi:site-specific DNA-methyltransferase (adenine-specific)